MSFFLTTPQFKAGIKDVTRRTGWAFLRKDDLFCAVDKGRGLKAGEKVERLGICKCVSNTPEPLKDITQEEVRREGFPDKTPEWFVDMFCKANKACNPNTVINRIEFKVMKWFCPSKTQ